MPNPSANAYDAQSIQILEELEAVRKRPAMYIGSTDTRGLHHLVWEIVDNAIDETLAGFGKKITVTIGEDNSVIVEDEGRGVPVSNHQSGVSAAVIIFTKLHAGGKFGQDGSGYKVSGGLHGVGASVVNALSEFVQLDIYRDGSHYTMRFENGGEIAEPLKRIGDSTKTGTKVWFKPSADIFSTTIYHFPTLEERLKESAYLIKGLSIVLKDERSKVTQTFKYDEGLKAYIDFLHQSKTPIHEPVVISGFASDIEVEVAFQFTTAYSDQILSFVNNVRTRDGGTHETGFKTALTKTFNDYAQTYQLLNGKTKKLEGADIREGLTAIISILVPEPILQFEGQTKNKLGTAEARLAVENIVSEKLSYFFQENPSLSRQLIDRSIKAQMVRDAARKARDEARMEKKSKKNEPLLSGKLAPAQWKDKNLLELFLVEGDSAGGSAKQGRDRRFQAILPLRGKVINTEKAKIEDVLKNEEISTIIHTIGAGMTSDFDLDACNYQKVIIMTDADTDGAHIQVLLLTFFFRYMRKLVEAGRIYIAKPPLYKVTLSRSAKEESMYAWDDAALEKISKKHKVKSIQRFKGLGEMNADQLYETTMNPNTRTLIQVKVDDLADTERRIRILMGDQVEPRRDWIEANVSFSQEDTFEIED